MRRVSLSVLVLFALTLVASPVLAQDESDEPMEIYYFPGGPEGGVFGTVKYNGAKHAAEILGDRVDLKVRWSDWSPGKMTTQFDQAIAVRPDGISIVGWSTAKSLVPKAIEKGIVVTAQNVPMPEMEKKYKGQGFGYVGQEIYKSGHLLGKEAAKRAGLEEGDKALVWGLKSAPTRGKRTRGAIDALEEAGVEVGYMEISNKVDKDPANGIPVITGYLSSNPETDLVITDHGGLTSTLDKYLKAAGYGPDEIYGAGFDLSPATVEAIQSGYTDLTLDQQPFLQGFLSVMQIYLSKKYKFSGLHIDTGSGLVHAGNIDQIAPLAKRGIR